MSTNQSGNDAQYEETHVHQVYDQIASHFSSTRFKPWPVVDDFLRALPPGSIGLDVGCGNGKYLTVRKDVYIVASDRSSELLKFASQHQPHSAVVADTLSLPHPNGMFDFAISIAVVHHLSTPQRRQESIRAILDTLRPGFTLSSSSSSSNNTTMNHKKKNNNNNNNKNNSPGQALIFVWALEQKASRRGWDTGMQQDILVPWVLKTEHDKTQATHHVTNSSPSPTTTGGATPKTFQRYYHLYRQGELAHDVVAAGGKVIRQGYDRDNWWAVCERLL